jgi:hypothetical protein
VGFTEPVYRSEKKLLIESEWRKDSAEGNPGALQSFGREESLDHPGKLESVQIVAMRGDLFSNRHQKTTEPQPELARKASRREEGLFDSDPFGIGDSKEYIASEVRIDSSLERDLDFTHSEARSVFLRTAVW